MSEQNTTPSGQATRRPSLARLVLALALLLGVAAGLSIVLLGRSHGPALPGGARQSPAAGGFYGTLALPARAAPPIALHNYLGRPVTLAQYRGRAVLVTFLYTHCPDICPLIASNLRVALGRLGPLAGRVQVIAVSVDPRGDTPATVARFVSAHEMTGRMQYLIGSAAELGPTWAAWSVGSTREAGRPDLVAHSALVYGVSASGRLTTIYPASFEPSQIVHDAPLLAAR
ncbi:MAG TPA: SCO family protein [Solirubrobacteraceae bacterium]|nr:SCO family protein [Solirubrobacteraceae bacterium]